MDSFIDFYRGRKVAVPGGGGFLGSYLVSLLQGAGAKVFVPRHEEFDFRSEEACRAYFEKEKPDIAVNCAAWQGGIGYHAGRQADLFLDNVKMGLFLMEAAHRAGVKKFVNVVAGCSYPGYAEKDELKEEEYWDGRVHDSVFSYGVARKMSTAYGLALQKQFRFNSIHLILANMYGPGEHFNAEQSKALAGLLKKFYEAKKTNIPYVEVWGTGRPIRDWLYVKDGAEGILRAGAAYEDVEPLNIASGAGISVADLAGLIRKIVGYEGDVRYDAARPDGALKKTFSVKKMEQALGWRPTTTLEQGIRETLAWLEKNYDYAVTH